MQSVRIMCEQLKKCNLMFDAIRRQFELPKNCFGSFSHQNSNSAHLTVFGSILRVVSKVKH